MDSLHTMRVSNDELQIHLNSSREEVIEIKGILLTIVTTQLSPRLQCPFLKIFCIWLYWLIIPSLAMLDQHTLIQSLVKYFPSVKEYIVHIFTHVQENLEEMSQGKCNERTRFGNTEIRRNPTFLFQFLPGLVCSLLS